MVFGRRYRVTEKIGAGGMADVYKAVDEVLGRTVAVKVLHARYAADESFAARFRQEAQAAANLQSPYIVNIYDWGRDGDTYYIVMELVRGTDLKTLIQQKGALDSRRVAEIGAQVCSALSVAHGYDVIHRDIKPHNIMVTPDGSVKVMDFGIARAGNTTMTQTGSVLGTAHYVSPEQAQGRPLSAASDLYSLGIVLYEASTGRLPFDADTPVAVALKQVNDQPVRPRSINPNIDPSLETVIGRAMAKNPADRYETAEAMKADLRRVAQGGDVPPLTMPATGAAAAAPTEVLPVGTSVMPQVGAAAEPGARTAVSRQPVRQRKRVWPWVVLALILTLAGLGVAWQMGLLGTQGKPVPDLTNMTRAEAQAEIAEAGFTLGEISEEYSEDVEEGRVIGQSPIPLASAEPGSKIDITISLGTQIGSVPDLAGYTEAEARDAITAAGFTPTPLPDQPHGEVERGKVISQNPKPGTQAKLGDPVEYVISSGPEIGEVPNVRGKTRAEAERLITEAGFKFSAKEQNHNTVPAGQVISQNPSGGLQVSKGSTVTVYISKGPATAQIPNVKGKTEADASAILTEAGFKVEVVYDLATDSGVVLDMSPSPGATVPRGSTVTIVVDGNGGGGGGG